MLFTFEGSNISGEEIPIVEQKDLIEKIVTLNNYKEELEIECQKLQNVDVGDDSLSTNKAIETTITVALEQVENEINKDNEALKNTNKKLIDMNFNFVNKYLGDNKFTWPVEGFTNVSQGFSSGHKGVDINTLEFNPRALNVQNGIVVFAGDDNDGYGNKVIVYFGDNLYALYGHLEQISVETGSFVFEGDEIGIVGNTGNSSGNHLHFEIFSKEGNTNNNFDPLDYLGK